jgi:hypothetical protein
MQAKRIALMGLLVIPTVLVIWFFPATDDSSGINIPMRLASNAVFLSSVLVAFWYLKGQRRG